ncbi:zincin [Trametes cingulata]|nr:zincin [Trametes cingulata]
MRMLPAFVALASSLLAASAAPSSVHVELDIPIPEPASSKAERPALHRAAHHHNASVPATQSAFIDIIDCDNFAQIMLPKAAEVANGYVRDAVRALEGDPHGISSRYMTWFGAPDPEGYETVDSVFKNVAADDFTLYTYRCARADEPECVRSETRNTEAWVDNDVFGVINLCPLFFEELGLLGGHSMASVIVHEATHFTVNGPTEDIAQGVESSFYLAIERPWDAVANAASYEFFASNALWPPTDLADSGAAAASDGLSEGWQWGSSSAAKQEVLRAGRGGV